ncbi:MAG: phosphatidate cytidylyltransferase [Draconibacterium sp.]|nr:MAG: phosphatidate cytidylyltransferase [Draconibacterium sp.]
MFAGIVIHPYLFAFVFLSFLIICQYEFYKLIEKGGVKPFAKTGIIAGIAVFLHFFMIANGFIPKKFVVLALIVPVVLFLVELFDRKTTGILQSLVTLGGVVYISLPFALLNFILIPLMSPDKTFYPWVLAGMIFIIWVFDSMAFVIGSLIGKHKMFPLLSPAKSWEGFVGGAVFAVIMGIINAVLFQVLTMAEWIALSLIVVVFAALGDFFESKLKRSVDVKDSGNLLPGHGGMLDRLDSLLFVSPAVFIWLILLSNI